MEATLSGPVASPYRPDLSVGHLFARAWPRFKDNLVLVVGSFAIFALISAIFSGSGSWGGSTLLSLIGLVITGPLLVGLYGVMLRVIRDEPAEITNLFDGFQKFAQAFGVYILMSVAVAVGMILLIVPGIIVAVGLWPALFLVYDDDRGVVETLQHAWDLTNGYKLQLFIVGLVLALLFIVGLAALFVGVLFTGAFAMLVGAAAYEEIALGRA
jgi:uncharacterized membrane protein